MEEYQEVSQPLTLNGTGQAGNGKSVMIVTNRSAIHVKGKNLNLHIENNKGSVFVEGENHQIYVVNNLGSVHCKGTGHDVLYKIGNAPTTEFNNIKVKCNGDGTAGQNQNQNQKQGNGTVTYNNYIQAGATLHIGDNHSSNSQQTTNVYTEKYVEKEIHLAPELQEVLRNSELNGVQTPFKDLECSYDKCPEAGVKKAMHRVECIFCINEPPEKMFIHHDCLMDLLKIKKQAECFRCGNDSIDISKLK